MTDASNPPANDLEAQLEALMKQAREGGGAPVAQAPAPATTAVATQPQAKPEAPAQAIPKAPVDLASQLDALMAKVGHAEPQAVAEQPLDTGVIADGPADVEDAFDELQGAFDAVQDIIADLDDEPVADAAPEAPPAPETEAQLQQRDDDLAAQLQSLLDEASAQEAQDFVSAEDLMGESPAEDQDQDELDGDFVSAVDEVIDKTTAPKPAVGDPALIDQIDSLLADHAEDAINGEFESVDELLGVAQTAGDNLADPMDGLDLEDEDDLGGDFQSMDDLLAKPESSVKAEPQAQVEVKFPPPAPRREEPAKELDEIDGLFEAPQAMKPAPAPSPKPLAIEDPAFEPDDDEDADEAGGFESLDALFAAPPPSIEDRDGAPPKAKGKAKAKAKTKNQNKGKTEGWSITLNLAVLQAAAALLLGWTLWTCAVVNKPVDKLPDEIKQTVGWVALAVAGPGVLLVVYGLLFN